MNSPKVKKALEEALREIEKMTPEELSKAMDEAPKIFDPEMFSDDEPTAQQTSGKTE